jgi:hypothetical protein
MGPPSLLSLIARIQEMEEFTDFLKLLRELLPEREREILNEPTPGDQIAAFASFFQDRYFPLHDGVAYDAECYSDLTHRIPVIPLGLSWDDYHEIPSDYRLGLQLMTYLVERGYEDEGEGARVPLAEECQVHVPRDLLDRVPQGGIDQGEVHILLDDTPHSALASWADYLNLNTGNGFLDMTYEDVCYECTEWSKDNVEALTQEWLEAMQFQQNCMDMADWLEEDPPGRFKQLLDFIDKRRVKHERRRSNASVGAA